MRYLSFIILLLVVFGIVALAQIPRTLSYQGVLTDQSGHPRPDDNYRFIFKLWNASLGGQLLWSSTPKTIGTNRGLFSTVLGDAPAFPDSVRFDRQYWLEVKVNDSTLLPRIPLNSVGYSMSALRADTAKVALSSSNQSIWCKSDSNIIFEDGYVGIGKNPTSKLDVRGRIQAVASEATGSKNLTAFRAFNPNGNSICDVEISDSAHPFGVLRLYDGENQGYEAARICGKQGEENWISGNIKIGGRIEATASQMLTSTNLSAFRAFNQNGNRICDVEISDSAHPFGILRLFDGEKQEYEGARISGKQGEGSWINGNFAIGSAQSFGSLTVFQSSNSDYIGSFSNGGGEGPGLIINAGSVNADNTILWVGSYDKTKASLMVNGKGHTITPVLEITGGSDLAEPFPTSETESLPAGSVVVIDETNPGQVTLSSEPYDKKVAGVVSGAGGIKPGLTLKQEGLMEGKQDIALSGRVYVLATASNGAIHPGDRLVTSANPGYCMKGSDSAKCDGAVIGKARSGLETGQGLVLLLVNLQ